MVGVQPAATARSPPRNCLVTAGGRPPPEVGAQRGPGRRGRRPAGTTRPPTGVGASGPGRRATRLTLGGPDRRAEESFGQFCPTDAQGRAATSHPLPRWPRPARSTVTREPTPDKRRRTPSGESGRKVSNPRRPALRTTSPAPAYPERQKRRSTSSSSIRRSTSATKPRAPERSHLSRSGYM